MKTAHCWIPSAVIAAVLLAGCGDRSAASTPDSPTPETAPASAATLNPADTEHSVTVGTLERRYLLHIPPGIPADGAVPVVFAFHGFGQSAEFMQVTTGLDLMSFTGGFAVVYPDGTGPANALSWNAGVECCGYAAANDIPEADFVRAILADLEKTFRADPNRIFATGFSNGAFLSYKLACEMPDVFAAIAPVGGGFLPAPCDLTQPVSLIHFHGLADSIVPYEGGSLAGANGALRPSIEERVAAWASLNQCEDKPDTRQEGRLTIILYSGCAKGTDVELHAIEGAAHTWPPPIPLPAAQIIWDFFSSHARQ